MLTLSCFPFFVSAAKREKYHKMPEIYSNRPGKIEKLEQEYYIETLDEMPEGNSINSISGGSVEDYLETAITGTSLEWKSLPESEYPRTDTSDMTAHYTNINVPLFMEMTLKSTE